jgi:DNA polymerase III subunit delta
LLRVAYNNRMDALAFLDSSTRKLAPVYVLHGDEDFLKRQVLIALRTRLFGTDGDEFGFSAHAGDKANFAEVHDELQTLPFLSPRRLVAVDNADPFVTRHRAALEKYVTAPAEHGILVLAVKTWPSNTRLAKLMPSAGTITCKAPAAYKLPEWCSRCAEARHGKQLPAPAARLLVELVGEEMGQLDQELAKLAAYVGPSPKIDVADVDKLVGHSRAANVFEILNTLAAGEAPKALAILEQLFDQGEEPIGVLAALGAQLRRLVKVGRLTRQGLSFAAAAERAGVPPFPAARQGCERQLRHIGRDRLDRLYDWLLETDQGMKGGSQLAPRTLLERLVVRLARPAT